MKSSELKITIDREPIRPHADEDIFHQVDPAANEPFDQSVLEVCEMLHQIDDAPADSTLGKEFSDIRELRSQLRSGLLRGMVWVAAGMCLISASFVVLAP